MDSTKGSGRGVGRGGSGGGVEEDGGESAERAKTRKDDQKKKGKIGRPPNKPVPPPRETPVNIVPRLRSEDRHRSARHGSPITKTTPEVTHTQGPPGHVRRKTRPLTDHLREDEYLTEISLMSQDGKYWTTLPNALVSPHWSKSYLAPETVESMNYIPRNLTEDELHDSVTPRGVNTDDKVVAVWMDLEEIDIREKLVALPILNRRNLGVSAVIGKPLIEARYGPNNWPPTDNTQYVDEDPVADTSYGEYHGAWSYDNYDSGGAGETEPALDPNVYLSMGDASINHDLTAVGAGIPDEYPEIPPGGTHWDWDPDGYLQET